MRSNFLFRALQATTALGLVAGIPAVASAQDASEEIIVTARRVNERLQDVPISITVFDQQQITNRNITNASDLATYTPSLSTDKRFGPENSSFAIRGFAQELRTSPSVGVYFADVVAPRGGTGGTVNGEGAGPGAFFDLQNVQVLKGPQGTLFGRNTTGGAVLLVPNKPMSELGGYVEGSFGNDDMRRVQGVLNLPINDKVRTRFGFDRQTRDGYLENVSGIGPNHLGNTDYISGRASIDVDITDNLENYTIATYSKSDTYGSIPQVWWCNPKGGFGVGGSNVCPAAVARLQGHDFWTVSSNDPNPRSYVEQWQIINTTTWHVSDLLTVKNIASYSQFRSILDASIIGDDFRVASGPSAGLPIHFTNAFAPFGDYSNAQDTATEEVQLQGKSRDERLTWQVGGYAEISNPSGLSGSLSQNGVYCPDPSSLQCINTLGAQAAGQTGGLQYSNGIITYRNYGIYSQGTYALTEQLKMTAGVRYTMDATEATVQQIIYDYSSTTTPTLPSAIKCAPGFPYDAAPGAPFNPVLHTPTPAASNNCTGHFRKTSDRPTWVLDLEWSPNRDLMAYVKYARGYRQGGVSAFSPGGANVYGPESVDTYEIGVKTSFHGKVPGIFNAAVFYNDFSNQQIQYGFLAGVSADASSTTAIFNAKSSRTYGAEIETSLNLLKDFRLDASATYIDAKVEDLGDLPVRPGFIVQPTTVADSSMPLTPRYKASVTGTYTLPIPESLGTLLLSATYTYTAKYLTNEDVFRFTDATNLVNMNLNWNAIGGGPVDAGLFVTNILNEEYTTSAGGLSQLGFDNRVLGEPRMYGLRVRLRYGS